jgi:prepilin-type N-terminal cleavage/methylation domain-containing protein
MPLRGSARPARKPARRGFTLLELLLASAIAVLLMAALYVAVDVQLRHAQAGRDVIGQSTLARSLLTRVSADIAESVAPPLPTNTSYSSSAASAGATAGGSTSAAASAAAGGGTAAASPATGAAVTSGANITGSVQFNLGVQGDNSRLILSISRVPRELNFNLDPGNPDGMPLVSDLRRVTYWLAGGNAGLARQELKMVTSDDATSAVPPDVPDELSYVIAEEVRSLTFSYWDGTSWQDSWDGTTPGADGVTPIGPPLAIAVMIGIAPPGANNDQNVKLYRHVVTIPTANGATQASTSSGTTTSNSTNTSNGASQ